MSGIEPELEREQDELGVVYDIGKVVPVMVEGARNQPLLTIGTRDSEITIDPSAVRRSTEEKWRFGCMEAMVGLRRTMGCRIDITEKKSWHGNDQNKG